MVIRAFKYGSLVLAVVGVALLLLVARQSVAPTVQIGSLTGTMNWAYVRVEGTVTRQPAYDPEAGTLKLWVGDGSGEIMVTAYRPEAEWLMAEDLVPVMGDGVALEGTLRIREEFQYLVLNVPQHTKVRPAEAVGLAIGDVGADRLYQHVTVRGVIRDDHTPYEGLRILTLRDVSGEIDVTLRPEAATLNGAWPELRVGQSVQVTGAVDRYRDTPQISVGRGSELVVLDGAIAIAPERRIGELSLAAIGDMAAVEGTIARADPFSAGVKCVLDDGSGTVTLLLWQDLYESLADREALVEGTRVRVLGEVAEYQGELEIVPELAQDVMVLAVAERVVPERHLGELSAGDVGQMVKVEGVLKSLRAFSAGVKGTLDDGTGTATLLLWEEVYDGLLDPPSLRPGVVLRVEGEVEEYKGELEVVPRAPADIVVVGMVEAPLEELAIGQVTADDVGQMVQVGGHIAGVTPFSAGVKLTLNDGSGAITLLLWQNIYDGLDDPDRLVVGARVSVRGEVAEYQGDLEVVPQFPHDIEVTGREEVAMITPDPTPEPTGQTNVQPTTQPTRSPPSTPSPTPTPTPERRTIGSITAADVGTTVTIALAGIADMDYFSAGVKYTLTDSTGRIILLVWQNVMEELTSRHYLFPGRQVRITGEIDEYQGNLEIVPRQDADVVVLNQSERPPVEERAVSNIGPSDEGRVFRIEGKVARTEARRWLRFWLNDGTGEILVFVPERVVAYLPGGIGAGVRLRVTGEVDIYQSQLEIIPLAGADVEVR